MSPIFDSLEAYQHLWDIGRHSGVASIVSENRNQEVENFSLLLKKIAGDPVQFIEDLRRINWYECESYAASLYRDYGTARFDERLRWTMWAVQEMNKDRSLHFGLSLEGLLVRFYETARAIHANLLDYRSGDLSPDWDSRTLDDLLTSLGANDDERKWARLLRLIRNDINFCVIL